MLPASVFFSGFRTEAIWTAWAHLSLRLNYFAL